MFSGSDSRDVGTAWCWSNRRRDRACKWSCVGSCRLVTGWLTWADGNDPPTHVNVNAQISTHGRLPWPKCRICLAFRFPSPCYLMLSWRYHWSYGGCGVRKFGWQASQGSPPGEHGSSVVRVPGSCLSVRALAVDALAVIDVGVVRSRCPLTVDRDCCRLGDSLARAVDLQAGHW